MTSGPKIVLDANILVRAVLGTQVPDLLERYGHNVRFYTPAPCFTEAREHLPSILSRRGHIAPGITLGALDALRAIVQPVDEVAYAAFEAEARRRIGERDMDDWPLLALAMALDCPIWTEDRDFFGTGIATWRTRNVEIYLSGSST